MARRELNIWLAFADVTFVLFLCALMAAAASSEAARTAEDKERQAAALAHRNEMRANMLAATNEELTGKLAAVERNRFSCADVDPLLDRLSDCIYVRLGRFNAVGRDICSVTVSEDLVEFRTGEDRPTEPSRAAALSACFCESARWFEQEHLEALRAIETVHIDGFTDCVGEEVDNARLGADRALELYRLLVRESGMSRGADDGWFRKVAVRSFGEERPVEGSPCPSEIDFKYDRRVRFSVDMRLRHASTTR